MIFLSSHCFTQNMYRSARVLGQTPEGNHQSNIIVGGGASSLNGEFTDYTLDLLFQIAAIPGVSDLSIGFFYKQVTTPYQITLDQDNKYFGFQTGVKYSFFQNETFAFSGFTGVSLPVHPVPAPSFQQALLVTFELGPSLSFTTGMGITLEPKPPFEINPIQRIYQL